MLAALKLTDNVTNFVLHSASNMKRNRSSSAWVTARLVNTICLIIRRTN
ncbi:hypothetical protein ACHAWU_007044 [Discostella pseudostelligera]|uniref:Uncharacterized protein n=1 Tax=Discostella pseudostelligera TaxID=259834 RepID=A0ABD3MGE9_9STRA